MKNKLSLMLLLVTFLSFAQSKFESGYFIDNSGTKTECLIKNYDWKNNPTNIEIKSINKNEIITKTIEDIAEFGINDKSKFVKATVKIDKSSQNFNSLSDYSNPVYFEKTVLLKVLVEGVSNLYYYTDKDFEKFFYSVNDKIEQLVYKQYNNSEGNISTNDTFKQQLFVNFKCNNDKKSILALKYKNNDLIDYFIKTNNCISGNNKTITTFKKRKFEANFKLNLLVNNINSTFIIPTGNIRGTYETEKKYTFTFGFETELIFPYNNKNWSLIFDPSYVKNKETFKIYQPQFINPDETFYNDSFFIRLPIGIRRYFKINENNKFFANAALSFNLIDTYVYTYNPFNNSTIVYSNESFIANSLAFGIGYQYKRYTAEMKLNTKTEFYPYPIDGTKFNLNQISLKLGYKLF